MRSISNPHLIEVNSQMEVIPYISDPAALIAIAPLFRLVKLISLKFSILHVEGQYNCLIKDKIRVLIPQDLSNQVSNIISPFCALTKLENTELNGQSKSLFVIYLSEVNNLLKTLESQNIIEEDTRLTHITTSPKRPAAAK